MIGCVGVILDFLIFVLLQNYLTPINANIISVSAGIINNFILNVTLNFKQNNWVGVRFLSFFATGLLGMTISSSLLTILIESIKINNIAAKVITVIFVALLQYLINKNITFRNYKKDGMKSNG